MGNEKPAKVELTADTRSFAKQLKDASKRWAAFGKGVGKGFGRSIKGIGKSLAGGAGRAAGMLGFGGAAVMIGSEIQKTVKFEESLTRLKIASRGTIKNMGQFRDQVFAVSNATGVAREDVLQGASAYVTLTGDAKTASEAMGLFSRIQKATGSSMDDIASSAAAMTQNLKIAPEDFEKAFSILIAGGKAGSVELRDMAGLMASLAPLSERFAGGGGTSGLANLGAALQLTRQGFGSAEEAATGLQALMGAIVQHADKLEDAGVKVFTKDKDGTKRMRNFQEIVEAIGNSKLAKDPTKLTKALGRKEALAAFIQLTKVDGAWDDLAKSTMDAKDVSEDYATFQQSTSGQMQKAWNDIKNTVAAALTPDRIQAFTEFLKLAIGVAAKLVDVLSNVPGYMEFLSGEGQVANNDKRNAFEGFATDRIHQIRMGVAPEGAKTQDLGKLAKKVLAMNVEEMDSYGVMDTDDQLAIRAGAEQVLREIKAGKKRDIEQGLGKYRGLGTGDRLDPAYYDPSMQAAPEPGEPADGSGVLLEVKPSRMFDVEVQKRLDNSPQHRTTP